MLVVGMGGEHGGGWWVGDGSDKAVVQENIFHLKKVKEQMGNQIP